MKEELSHHHSNASKHNSLPLPHYEQEIPAIHALIENNGNKHKLTFIGVSTIEDMMQQISLEISLPKSSFSVEYFDEDVKDYVDLTPKTFHSIPNPLKLKTKPSMKVNSNFASWKFTEKILNEPKCKKLGYTTTQYYSLQLNDKKVIYHGSLFQKLSGLLVDKLNGVSLKILRSYAIYNPKLMSSFEAYCASLENKWRQNPHLFKKDDWIQKDDREWRLWLLSSLNDYISSFAFNASSNVKVIPMAHGTTESAVWQICQTGFGIVSTVDQGWYGKGNTTSKLQE